MAVGRERGGDSASLTRRESQLGNTGAEACECPARIGLVCRGAHVDLRPIFVPLPEAE
jgi:hypothetical protein